MHIVRRGLLIMLTPLLSLLLFATAFDWGIVKTVGRPAVVKQIVSESGIYGSLAPSLLDKVGKVETRVGSLPTSDPSVIAAANQAFSPKYVQTNAETTIDSIYAWLEGKTAVPNFRLDLSAAKTNFADSLSAQLQQRAAQLPRCTTPYTSTSFDITDATCLPQQISADAVGQAIKNDVIGGKDLIENSIISAGSFKDSNSNNSIFQSQFKDLPLRYQQIKKTPVVLLLLTMAIAAAIYFLSPNHLKGLRHLGITLLVAGVIMLVFAWGLNKAVATQVVPNIVIKDNALMTKGVRTLATDIAQRIDKNYWTFGMIYLALGTAAISTPIIIKRRAKETADNIERNPTSEAIAVVSPNQSKKTLSKKKS